MVEENAKTDVRGTLKLPILLLTTFKQLHQVSVAGAISMSFTRFTHLWPLQSLKLSISNTCFSRKFLAEETHDVCMFEVVVGLLNQCVVFFHVHGKFVRLLFLSFLAVLLRQEDKSTSTNPAALLAHVEGFGMSANAAQGRNQKECLLMIYKRFQNIEARKDTLELSCCSHTVCHCTHDS